VDNAGVTFADLERLLGAFLVGEWLARVGWSRDDVTGFLEHGIPIEYARTIADVTGGAVPLTFWPKLIHPPKVLHKRLRSSSVNEPSMEKSHRLAISEGHKSKDETFRRAIRKAGFSQNGLAERLGINQAVLSLHRRGVRKIPLARAKRIEALTGWPADAKHWPVGIVTDGE
jgi:hypothetical protein